jgi:thiamine phosphate synthase YjbQ (UPF0047 family)
MLNQWLFLESKKLAVGSWQLAVGSWQLAVGSWQFIFCCEFTMSSKVLTYDLRLTTFNF